MVTMWHQAPKGSPGEGGVQAELDAARVTQALGAVDDANPGLGPPEPGAGGRDAGLSPGDTHGHLGPKAFIESLVLPRALVRAQGMAGVQAPPFRSSGSSWGSWERALTPGSPAYHTPRGSC